MGIFTILFFNFFLPTSTLFFNNSILFVSQPAFLNRNTPFFNSNIGKCIASHFYVQKTPIYTEENDQLGVL